MLHVDHEYGVGQPAHVLDAAEAALELAHQAALVQGLLLGEHVQGAVLGLLLQFLEPLDGLADGLVVGEHAAEPALVDEGHLHPGRLLANDLGGRSLGADEQDLLAQGGHAANLGQRLLKGGHGPFEIDDVNLVSGAENERGHFRIPVPGAMAEVDARGQHVAHTDVQFCLRVEPPQPLQFRPDPRVAGTREFATSCVRCVIRLDAKTAAGMSLIGQLCGASAAFAA